MLFVAVVHSVSLPYNNLTYEYISQFLIYSTSDGNLSFSPPILAIMNKAAINIAVYVSSYKSTFTSVGHLPKMKCLGQKVCLFSCSR